MNLATPDAMFDALPGPTPASDDKGQAPAAPASPDPAAAPAEPDPGQPTDPPAEGTTPEPEGTATPPEPASALDKGLEPFKDFFTNKGLDPKATDFVPKVVQMAKEAEGLIGRKATETALITDRMNDLQRGIMTGGMDAINRVRESHGLPKLEAARPVADQIKEKSELISHVMAIYGPNPNPDSVKWLNERLFPELDALKLKAAVADTVGTMPADKAHEAFLQGANANINKFIGANQAAIPHLDALLPLVGDGGLLASHGIDRAQMASSPERLAAWAKVGEAVWLMQPDPKAPGKTNLQSYVASQVQAAQNAERLAKNQGRPTGAPGARNTVGAKPLGNGSPLSWNDFGANPLPVHK
jgi:hypothetical protein